MPITEGTDALPVDVNANRLLGLLRPDNNLYAPRATASGDLRVSPEVPWNFHGTITRPNNTTGMPYAAGEMLGDTGGWSILSVTGAATSNGGSGRLDELLICVSSNQSAPLPLLDVLIFGTAASPTAHADQAAAAFSDADNEFLESILTVQTWMPANVAAGASGNQIGRADAGQLPLRYKCGSGQTTLFVACRWAAAYSGLAAEKFEIKLRGVQLS